jgi:lipopolysaccharide export system permease protein
MRTLDRLVATTFLKLWVAVTLATPPLFNLGDFTENLDSYLDRGLTRFEVAQAYFYKLPEYFQFAFPIAALVATVFTIHTMTRHREIVAAKAGGISFHRVMAPLVVIGVTCACRSRHPWSVRDKRYSWPIQMTPKVSPYSMT